MRVMQTNADSNWTHFLTHLFRNHTQLLKVDELLHLAVVAQVDERQVLLDNGVEGDDGGLDIVGIDKVSITTHVPTWVHQLLHLSEKSLIF